MKNLYDIKRDKKLNFIFFKEEKNENRIDEYIYDETVLVIHIYYKEKVLFYLKYIENVPDKMHIIFTVSSKEIKIMLARYLDGTNKLYKIILKNNRGRDISSLLIAAKKDILQYKYVCFLHDKKAKKDYLKADIEQWEYSLWENTIGSRAYIESVLHTLKNNDQIGMLTPPPPITDNLGYGYSNIWGDDFKITEDLAAELGLDCDLDKTKSPVAIGTVFWAKVDALKKLFWKDWKYEDFDEEPLKNDGTISHAIERLLSYVVQDAGYDVGWIMTDHYAAEKIEYSMDVMNVAFETLKCTQGLYSVLETKRFLHSIKEIVDFCFRFSNVYIYGAGNFGKRCFCILSISEVAPTAFLITDKKSDSNFLFGIPIYTLDDILLDEKSGIVIAVKEEKNRREILEELQKRDFSLRNIMFYL